jgi:hypothetical protein
MRNPKSQIHTFYVVECFTGADVSPPIVRVLYQINSILRVIATVLQTSFILQMKQYRKTGEQKSCCSIQNTFLFMCCMNLGFWVSHTFKGIRAALPQQNTIYDTIRYGFASGTYMKIH